VKKLLPDLQKRFEDILSFHNSMINEKKKKTNTLDDKETFL
jgi:hypothetical protein